MIPRKVRRTNQRLAKLVAFKVLERRGPVDRLSPNTVFYHLGERAARALDEYDPIAIRERRTQAKDFGDSYLRHLYLVNSVHIKFRTHQETGYQFLSWTPYDNTNWDKKSALPLRPDGYVRFRMNGEYFSYFVEIDRGTERGQSIRKKLQEYHTFDFGDSFWKTFKQDWFRVLFVVTEPSRSTGLLKIFPSKIFWVTTIAEMLERPLFEPCWHSREGTFALNRAPDAEQAGRAEKRREAALLASAPQPPIEQHAVQEDVPSVTKKSRWSKEHVRFWLNAIAGAVGAYILILFGLGIYHEIQNDPATQIFSNTQADSVAILRMLGILGMVLLASFALSK